MTVPRKRNIAGYVDEQGRFRPIRSPQYVGTPKRKAKERDKKKYSRAKAGDLGKKRQALAREDVFDRAIRKDREAKAKADRIRDREMREIERDIYGTKPDGRLSQSLMQFVRASGGIRRTYRHGGKKAFGRRSSYDAGEIDRLSNKETGKRGLTTDKGGLDLDYMFQAAREAGYDVADIWDMVSRIEDEAGGGTPTYPTHGSMDYRDNPNMKSRKKNPSSASRLARTAIAVFDADLDLDLDVSDVRRLKAGEKTLHRRKKVTRKKATRRKNPIPARCIISDAAFAKLQSETRRLASRKKNVPTKRNPVGWFKDVSPVTAEAVKKLYRKLASQWHPDKAGGDLRKMQQINADYDKALNIAANNEGNEYRADAERKAAKPLREAIEFAVTLPDNINVVIRGLWLWLEGNTYAAKDQIKSFKSSDGNRFKWANKKKAWFFAAVPSSNRRGEMSFDEIDRLHGRELVNDRKRRLSLNPKRKKKRNPIHPITAFATGASGILSALQIKELVNRPTRRKKPGTTLAKRNRKVTKRNPTLAEVNRCRKVVAAADRELKRESAKIPITYADNPKARPKIPHRRTFTIFQGRPATKASSLQVSQHAPARLDQLGDLIEVKLTNGQVLKLNPTRFKLCASGGKLWIAGGKFAKANPAEKTNVLNPIAEIAHVVYGTYKPHHGDNNYTHYIHKLGEVSGKRPILAVDREGFPVIRGGNYKIEARGIVD